MPVCAVLLGANPESFRPKDIACPTAGQRQSYLRTFRFVQPPATRLMQEAGPYQDVVMKIYGSLGVKAEVIKSTVDTDYTELMQVEAVGPDGSRVRVGVNASRARYTAHTVPGLVGREGEGVALVREDRVVALLPAPAEDHGVAPFEADHEGVGPGVAEEEAVVAELSTRQVQASVLVALIQLQLAEVALEEATVVIALAMEQTLLLQV